MKQTISVRKCSLGVATRFMLHAGELTACTPAQIEGSSAAFTLWSAQGLLQVSVAKLILGQSLIYMFKIGFKSNQRNDAWINFAFFAELGIVNLLEPYNILRHQ